MKGGVPIAETVVRAWVRLYTVGLDRKIGHDRRAEIDSDLWEQRHHASAQGEGHAATSRSIIGRWAAGIPADLSWRVSLRRRGRLPEKENTVTRALENYWQALAAITAVATGYLGIRQFVTDEVSTGISTGKVVGLVLLAGAGLLALAGLAIHRSNPRRGALLVMVGVLPVAAVGGFGIGGVVGLVVSLAGGLGWWWVPLAVASAVATAAGLGAFGAWWHASPDAAVTDARAAILPLALVLIGLLAAGTGVGLGWSTGPLIAVGALCAAVGIGIWSRRIAPLR